MPPREFGGPLPEETGMDSEETARKKVEFILKLAEASNLDDEEAADAIAAQLRSLENDKNFPDIFDLLDPDQFHSETKLLSDTGKKRLRDAYEKFTP